MFDLKLSTITVSMRIRSAMAIALSVQMVVFPLIGIEALALGGTKVSEGSGRLERHAIMVLGDRGNVCSGTVIGPSIVITAAHCVTGSKRYAVSYKEGASPILQEVQEVVRHPQYKANSRVSVDIALIRTKVPLPSQFRSMPLDEETNNTDDNGVGTNQTLAGFGLGRDNDDSTMGILRVATATVLPRYYPRFFRLGGNGMDVLICKGDSGGGVFKESLVGSSLTGVIFGKEKAKGLLHCGTSAQAVRIAPQRRWIDGVMAKWSR